MKLEPIGIIHSSYEKRSDAPPQGRMKMDIFEIEVFEKFIPGLKDIEGASHLIVLYWCDRSKRDILVVNTPWDTKPHGVFATRSPARPNPIAFDIVDLVERQGNILKVKGMDALDKSPLIDIKPYNSRTDAILNAKLDWFQKAEKQEEKQMDLETKWEEAIKFHGHTCPGLALGVRASIIALEKLGVKRATDEELVAVVETDACGVDGVQVITGCTLGKGNLIFRDYGKQVYTIARRRENKGIRIAFFNTNSSEEQKKLRENVFSGRATSEEKAIFKTQQEKRIQDILFRPEAEICKVELVDIELPAKASIFNSVRCDECGEYFMEPRGRLQGGKVVCLTCFREYTR